MKIISGVYQIVNKVNGKVYIGSSTDLRRRKKQHFSELNRDVHCNAYLQNSFNKHGRSNFRFEILVTCDAGERIQHEQKFIDEAHPEYNICQIAGTCLGYKHTEESKIKMAIAATGKFWSDEAKKKMSVIKTGTRLTKEHKKKISNAIKGKKRHPLSDEHKQKLIIANTGKTHSEETRLKMSESHSGKVFTDEHRANLSKNKREYYRRKKELENEQ